MMSFKKIIKWIIIILLVLIIGFICYLLYDARMFDNILGKNKKNVEVDKSGVIASKNDEITESNEEEDSTTSGYTVEKKDYSDYYNEYNFDDVILLYEGTQNSNRIKELLDRLVTDADDSFYSKPSVKFENFNSLSSSEITSNNLVLYKEVLNQAKNSVNSDDLFEVSFEYNKYKTIVNKILILKK